MKVYQIAALVTVGVTTRVEANSEEEALKIASERKDMMSIASNNGDSIDEVWMVEELDGEPYRILIEGEI